MQSSIITTYCANETRRAKGRIFFQAKCVLMAFRLQKFLKFQNVPNGFKVLWFENVTYSSCKPVTWVSRIFLAAFAFRIVRDYFSYGPNHVDSFFSDFQSELQILKAISLSLCRIMSGTELEEILSLGNIQLQCYESLNSERGEFKSQLSGFSDRTNLVWPELKATYHAAVIRLWSVRRPGHLNKIYMVLRLL